MKWGHLCLWLLDISLVHDLEVNPGLMEKKPNFRYVKGLLRATRQPLFVEPASLASTLSVQG